MPRPELPRRYFITVERNERTIIVGFVVALTEEEARIKAIEEYEVEDASGIMHPRYILKGEEFNLLSKL